MILSSSSQKLQQQSTFIASIDKDGENMIWYPIQNRESTYLRIYQVGNIITIIIMVVFL